MDTEDDLTAAAEFESVGGDTGQRWVKPSTADPFILPPSGRAIGGPGAREKKVMD